MTEIAFTQMKDIKEVMLSDISNERISQIILSEGDTQDHNTNLKCDMTQWKLHEKYKDVKWKPDMSTIRHYGERDFMEALSYIGVLPE